MLDIEAEISAYFKKKNKDYLTISVFHKGVPIALLKSLGLTRKSSIAAVIAGVKPYLGQALRISKGTRTFYIVCRSSPEEIVMQKIRQKPNQRLAKLGQHLPMTKKEFVAVLNRLLQQGKIVCFIDERYSLLVTAVQAVQPSVLAEDDLSLFKQAFQQIGKGRNFVFIYQLRHKLSWESSRFDQVLNHLRQKYIIELQGGDPSQLNDSQLRDSFIDEKGRLRITVSWR